MKYAKTLYTACIATFVLTLIVLAVIILDVCKVFTMPSGLLLVISFCFMFLLFLSFCSGCVLQTLYDDWKWRHPKNGKWQK